MSNSDYQVLDTIIKLYRNNNDKVIGAHQITIIETRPVNPDPIPGKVNNNRFLRVARPELEFRRINYSIGESRVVSKVQWCGKYDDFILNQTGDDIVTVIYLGTDTINELRLGLSQLPTIGDTL